MNYFGNEALKKGIYGRKKAGDSLNLERSHPGTSKSTERTVHFTSNYTSTAICNMDPFDDYDLTASAAFLPLHCIALLLALLQSREKGFRNFLGRLL